jgi:hypothetical protein
METQLALFIDANRPHLDLAGLGADEMAVISALSWGAGSARKVSEIAAAAGVPSRRVQEILHRLLHERGLPIGTSMTEPFGNYLIDTAEELERTVELLRRRGISNLARAAALSHMSVRRYLDLVQRRLPIEGSE